MANVLSSTMISSTTSFPQLGKEIKEAEKTKIIYNETSDSKSVMIGELKTDELTNGGLKTGDLTNERLKTGDMITMTTSSSSVSSTGAYLYDSAIINSVSTFSRHSKDINDSKETSLETGKTRTETKSHGFIKSSEITTETHDSPVSIITTLSMPINSTFSTLQDQSVTLVNKTISSTSTLYVTSDLTVSKSTAYYTQYSTVLVPVTTSPSTTFGYVYTQPYEVTGKATTFQTNVPTTVTVVTNAGATTVSLSNYATMTVSNDYYKQDILRESSGRLQTPKLAGSITGSIAGLVVILVLLWFLFRKAICQKKTSFKEKPQNPFVSNNNVKTTYPNKPYTDNPETKLSKILSKLKKPAPPPIVRRDSADSNTTSNSIRTANSTASSNSDNGLFAIRDNILLGLPGNGNSNYRFLASNLTSQTTAPYSRNRIIDTVYEESTESLHLSRHSSRASSASSIFKTMARKNPRKSVSSTSSSPEVRIPEIVSSNTPNRPASISALRNKKHSQRFYSQSKSGVSGRYAHAGLRKYYISENPFETGGPNDTLDDESFNNEFDAELPNRTPPVPPMPRKSKVPASNQYNTNAASNDYNITGDLADASSSSSISLSSVVANSPDLSFQPKRKSFESESSSEPLIKST